MTAYMRSPLALVAAASLALGACNTDRLTVPNQNSPSPGTGDVATTVQFAVNGILAQRRNNAGVFVRDVGIFGRELFNYTSTETRNTTGFLVSPQDPAGFGSGLFFGEYRNLRNILELKTQVGAATTLTAEQTAGILGFAQTMEALELYYLIATRDTLGIPVEVSPDPSAVTPFVSRDSAYNRVIGQLDSARANLQAAGASFSFTLTSGFTGFNTPATFLQFNRAFYARVQAYRGSQGCGAPCYQQVLTALAESFLREPTTAADLQLGVYNVFSSSPGDTPNPLSNVRLGRIIVAHPSIKAVAPAGDLRLAAKTAALTPAVAAPGGETNGIPTDVALRVYATDNSPVAIIRNEELILLRAEASYFTGNALQALADINTIRTLSGGLAPRGPFTSDDDFITELLLQRQLSLLAEGHRWFDVRRFGRLGTLPVDIPTHVIVGNQVIPQAECLARTAARVGPELAAPGCPR